MDAVYFNNVWSSLGEGHFPVSISQLNSWICGSRITLLRTKGKNSSNIRITDRPSEKKSLHFLTFFPSLRTIPCSHQSFLSNFNFSSPFCPSFLFFLKNNRLHRVRNGVFGFKNVIFLPRNYRDASTSRSSCAFGVLR